MVRSKGDDHGELQLLTRGPSVAESLKVFVDAGPLLPSSGEGLDGEEDDTEGDDSAEDDDSRGRSQILRDRNCDGASRQNDDWCGGREPQQSLELAVLLASKVFRLVVYEFKRVSVGHGVLSSRDRKDTTGYTNLYTISIYMLV